MMEYSAFSVDGRPGLGMIVYTVLTREMLDDMNATSVRGALGSVAGVTIGR
jgi:hypothetical protein